MIITDFERLQDDLFNACKFMSKSKGVSYANDEDVSDNFIRNAEKLGLTRFQVWQVYFNKHIDAINNAVKNNPEFPVDNSEGLDGRIIDSIVYLTLLKSMLEDMKGDSNVDIHT